MSEVDTTWRYLFNQSGQSYRHITNDVAEDSWVYSLGLRQFIVTPQVKGRAKNRNGTRLRFFSRNRVVNQYEQEEGKQVDVRKGP